MTEQNTPQSNDGFNVVQNRRSNKGDRSDDQNQTPRPEGGFTRRNTRVNRRDVLEQVAAGDLAPEEANKMLSFRRSPRFVVTRNGAIALYNLHRYPVVLYADQWEKIESLMKNDIFSTFVDRNKDRVRRRFTPPGQNQTDFNEQEQSSD